MPAKSLRSIINSTLLLSLLLVAGLAVGANVMQPASAQTTYPGNTYIVTNTNNSGSGSLRQAIMDANGNSGLDTISFDIPGSGVHTITPMSSLPGITGPVIIDGYTQPGSSPNTLQQGDNAVLLVELNGSTAGSANGLVIGATGGGSTVRGLVVNRFQGQAVSIQSGGNSVTGNFIGTGASGNTALANGNGVIVIGTSNNTVGGTGPGARNLLSGNTGNAVGLWGASNNLVEGNYIGTNAAGAAALPNNNEAIWVDGHSNTIGGTAAGAGNLISGNEYGGVSMSTNATGNLVQGNYIGTDVTGNTALPNYSGVNLFGSASNNTIGGTTPGARNLISGNDRVSNADGIFLQNGSGNVIQGNYIGTNAAGTASIPNASDGIWLGGPNNIVGGTQAGAGNLISGNGTPSNGADGIGIGSRGNVLQGNRIGTDASGSGPLPNTFGGVILWSGSISNTIGGTAGGASNVIAFNTGGPAIGITGTTSVSNTVLSNSIYGNTSILGAQGGIDLGLDGVTPNQNCGGRSGPNHLLNYPVLTSATSNGSSTIITGSLNSTPSSTYTIEFFYNDTCDLSGYGQGRYYIGGSMVTTNGSCITNFTVTFPIAVPSGDFVTSDATVGSGDTSEFSHCVQSAGGSTPTPTPHPTGTPVQGTPTATGTPQACNIQFTDVPLGSTFYPYIHCLACLGIINGYPDGRFRPNNPVTRGQLSKIVSNSAGFSDSQTSQVFQDVPVGSTFFQYIGRLVSRGYISGYSCGGVGEPCVPPANLPYFRTNNNATRGQISKIVSNAAGFSDTPTGQQFQDVAPGSTYYTYTYRLVSRQVMSGYPCGTPPSGSCVPPTNLPYFLTNNNATRGQTSKIDANTFFPDCSTETDKLWHR